MPYRKNPADPDILRQLATARLSGRSGGQAAALLDLSQVQRLLEELEIHQIELELQNEHLNTARAQLEQALNQSNELYDFSPVGSVLIDAEGNITRLNLAAAQLLASERARLIGSRFALFVAEEQRARFSAMLAQAQAEHDRQTAELTLQINGWEPLLVQLKVVWIGPELGWQLVLVDVSERQRMEAQLRASEERLTLALSAVGDWVFDWQVSSGEVVISDTYAPALGWSREELGSTASDLMRVVHPDDKPSLMLKLQDCINGISDRYAIYYRVKHRDGSILWLLARGAAVLRDKDGKALRVLGTLVNVTHNKQAEAKLAEAAQFQRAILDSISAQVAVLDHDGMILQTNAAWHKYMTDCAFEESVGKSYLALLASVFTVDPALLSAVTSGMAALVTAEGPHFSLPMPLQSRCGRWWFTIRITAVHDAAQRVVATHEDVTVLKCAELASAALANVDHLTDALSRQNFMALAEQEMARALRYALPLVVLMLDLDHFKNVNDSHGHPAGDAVLKGFVQTVKEVLRESDVIGRIGGEEFAVLLPNTTQDGACALANRILAAVRASPVSFEGHSIAYTVSIGASDLAAQKSFGALLAESDAALYRAKKAGRDRLEVSWDSSTPAHLGDTPPTVLL